MQSSSETKQLVLAALLTALGIALQMVEGLLPLAAPFPGAKIGLANIAILLCLYSLPLKLTLSVFGLRILLASILLGTFLSAGFFIGGAGGLLSFVIMLAARRLPEVSVLGVSIAGAAAHNLGQVCMATLLIGNTALLYYLPIALLLAIPAGFFTGFVARMGLALLTQSGQRKKPA